MNQSECVAGFYHDYKLVKILPHGVIERCAKCKNQLFFKNDTPNILYLSHHLRQTLQKDNALEVDHMIEIGSFEGSFDAYIAKMYCDLSNLQALCTDCHNKKTHFGNASMKYERKKIA